MPASVFRSCCALSRFLNTEVSDETTWNYKQASPAAFTDDPHRDQSTRAAWRNRSELVRTARLAINGCAWFPGHAHERRPREGETEQRLYLVSRMALSTVLHRSRARALAWTRKRSRRIADKQEVSDEVYEGARAFRREGAVRLTLAVSRSTAGTDERAFRTKWAYYGQPAGRDKTSVNDAPGRSNSGFPCRAVRRAAPAE